MKKNILYCSLALLLTVNIKAEEYGLNSNADTDTVFFRSPARLEFIQGKTNYIKGNFQFNPQNPGEKISGVFKVDLRTLNTGIETRDEHMRENHLHTDQYPFAFFELLEFDDIPERIIFDSIYTLIGGGYFYIHGIKRKIYPNITFSSHESSDSTIATGSRVR
ncbi:MAG: YceI family protein [Candidatus Zixiibacteriota bacterium]